MISLIVLSSVGLRWFIKISEKNERHEIMLEKIGSKKTNFLLNEI